MPPRKKAEVAPEAVEEVTETPEAVEEAPEPEAPAEVPIEEPEVEEPEVYLEDVLGPIVDHSPVQHALRGPSYQDLNPAG